jgi:hypothetical protein
VPAYVFDVTAAERTPIVRGESGALGDRSGFEFVRRDASFAVGTTDLGHAPAVAMNDDKLFSSLYTISALKIDERVGV